LTSVIQSCTYRTGPSEDHRRHGKEVRRPTIPQEESLRPLATQQFEGRGYGRY
jgi:hypothetical protein